MKLPKFHDRKSLAFGAIAGIFVMAVGWSLVDDGRWLVGLLQVGIGLGLVFHCLDMIRYYKRHRIVKIVKTDAERLVYKENAEQDKGMV